MSDVCGIVSPEVSVEMSKIEKLLSPSEFDELKGIVLATEPENRMKLLWDIEDDLYKADLCTDDERRIR